MLVEGRWHPFDDNELRPVVDAYVRTATGDWEAVIFLLDSGSDLTVFDTRYLPLLSGLAAPLNPALGLGGVGGKAGSIFVNTQIAFTRADGKRVTVNGQFGVFTDASGNDMPVLGRDVTNNFDVIYSFPKRQVSLLAAPHTFVVQLPF